MCNIGTSVQFYLVGGMRSLLDQMRDIHTHTMVVVALAECRLGFPLVAPKKQVYRVLPFQPPMVLVYQCTSPVPQQLCLGSSPLVFALPISTSIPHHGVLSQNHRVLSSRVGF